MKLLLRKCDYQIILAALDVLIADCVALANDLPEPQNKVYLERMNNVYALKCRIEASLALPTSKRTKRGYGGDNRRGRRNDIPM
jgi:hypothetical protein